MLGSAICVIDRSSASNTIAALTTKRTSDLLVRGIPTTATPRAERLPHTDSAVRHNPWL